MRGLLFPKTPKKKKKQKHHESIIPGNQKGTCWVCDQRGYTETHHIFGGSNRKYSEEYGLTVNLCLRHHRESPHAVHQNKDLMNELHRIGQIEFERKCGSREEFIRIFGKNYLGGEKNV